MDGEQFDEQLRSWVSAFCEQSADQIPPDEAWYAGIRRRLPQGLRRTLELGLARGAIIPLPSGKFTLAGLPSDKNYSWFGEAKGRPPWVNWEWFVHAAEYARVHALATPVGFEVKFEHERMDVAVYNGERLFACYEVKESARKLDALILKVVEWGRKGVDLKVPDRNNDPLRKAKYLARSQPSFFSAVAIGKRYEFSVNYTIKVNTRTAFDLASDVIPFG
jgi:hypothetical protein